MEYRRFGNTVIVRMDPGEEILEQVKAVALKENIKLAQVNALGAVKEFTIGVYSVPEQKYYSEDYAGAFEIVSLHGSINTMDGEFYTHLHMSAGNQDGQMFGGHLNRAVISATCEMFITIIDGEVDRKKDPVTGLNIFKFQ